MIEEVESKIMKWLKEEKFSPTKRESPGAYFQIDAKVSNLVLSVIHGTYYLDSLEVAIGFAYSPDQMKLLNQVLKENAKKAYYNQLHLELQRHPYIWNYHFSEDYSVLTMCSKRLYYDSLTKDAFMHLFLLMAKMFKLPVTLLEPYFWAFWPEWTPPAVKEPSSGHDEDLERMR